MKPTKLIAYIKDEENAQALIQRYLKSEFYIKAEIEKEVQGLKDNPLLEEFFFPDAPTSETENLFVYEGHATADKNVISTTGHIRRKKVELKMTKLTDKAGKFEFILQKVDENAHIVICKIFPEHRRKGLFSTMVKAITNYAFNKLECRTVSGNARPPVDDYAKDWRMKKVLYRRNLTTGKPIKLTKLHTLWLKQPYAVHGAMCGSEDPESFAILNPAYLHLLSHEDLVDFDKRCPKQKQNTFVELVK